MDADQPYVLLDVDGVCIDYRRSPMPGIVRLVEALRALGYGIVLWSGAGKGYCEDVAKGLGITVDACHAKPDYPITEADALALLGYPPALQLDDDPTEQVADWLFMEVPEAAEATGRLLSRATERG